MAQTFAGLLCLFFGLALTFFFPIQRGRVQNQLWDLIVLGLFVAGAYFLNLWGLGENIVAGVVVGVAAILIRDFRLWMVRFRDRAYGRGHRYHWYGRARDWYGRRRRRRW
ncbi:MAG: hypothetical protein JNL09_02820 [Anaerolineales bacterium]|nr:hypothetical protein [Anaerolineales bacterium]